MFGRLRISDCLFDDVFNDEVEKLPQKLVNLTIRNVINILRESAILNDRFLL